MNMLRTFVVVLALSMLAATCPSPTPTSTSTPITIANSSVYWVPPTTNTDGTQLIDLEGFKIYYGMTSILTSMYIVPNASTSSVRLNAFLTSPGTYYLSITAYDTLGLESDKSSMYQFTAQ